MSALFSCSLDDGHPHDMKAADLLSSHGLRASFYLPVRNCEGQPVLSASQIRELGTAFEIGSHTLDHRYLRKLNATDARIQVVEGKQRLEDLLGESVQGFCYPGGKYLREHVRLVKDAGFQHARTITNLRFDYGDRVFEMPTTIQFFPHNENTYLRNFIRGGGWASRRTALSIALSHHNWIERLYALFDHASRTDSVFHMWAHTKDIENSNSWQQFDHFLAYVAANTPVQNRLDNAQLAALAGRSRGAPASDQSSAVVCRVK